MIQQTSWFFRLGSVAIVVALLLSQRAVGQGLRPKDFEGIKTLKEAVEVVKERLRQEGKPEYAALLSEARLREAIRTAVEGYEGLVERKVYQSPGSGEYFEKEVKPVCEKIAETGEWPQGCSFFKFHTLKSQGISYDGLGLRLQIETPQARSPAFALPVVDLYFGRWEEPFRTEPGAGK